MFSGKEIFAVTGLTCSGKGYICSLLDKNKCEVIELDKMIRLYPMFMDKRIKIIETEGIEKLERMSAPFVIDLVKKKISSSNKSTIIIDGYKSDIFFKDIVDKVINVSSSNSLRKLYSKKKGWNKNKFNFLNKVQKT